MSSDIVVKRGLDLKLVGKSALKIAAHKSTSDFSIYPSDFHGVFPKLLVKENDKIQNGLSSLLQFQEKSQKSFGENAGRYLN